MSIRQTNFKIFSIIAFCSVALSSLCEAKDFNISSLSKKEKEGYCFIRIKYKAGGEKAENLQLKVYVLLVSGKEQTLAKTSFGVEVQKGYTSESLYISPADLKSKGKPKKLRAEIWSEVGGESVLVCVKGKPKWHKGKEKWWELDIPQCAIEKGGKDILDLIKKMEDE